MKVTLETDIINGTKVRTARAIFRDENGVEQWLETMCAHDSYTDEQLKQHVRDRMKKKYGVVFT